MRPPAITSPRRPAAACVADCDANCPTPCALASLPAGIRVRIVRVACPRSDAHRLRVLGLFEGACVRIVDRGSGLLLDVCGARLAVGRSLAAAITALPLT